MSVLINPRIASCDTCGWELACATLDEATRRLSVHISARHASVEAVTGLMAADPIHASDIAEIVAAIELDANANGGEVDPNRVRQLLPSHVLPQAIGATYQTLIRQGRLRECGWTTNKDYRGRNAGRPQRLYEWVAA